jgi:glycosyltransferase involved in cell wall biosynthesis
MREIPSRPGGPGIRPSVALVHERFTDWAGSEKVVEQLSAQWPQAAVLAPITDLDSIPPAVRPHVVPGSLTRFLRGGSYAHLLPVLPTAMRHLKIPASDVVIASHHAFATQASYATDAPVIAYVHSPARWVWDAEMREGEAGGRLGQLVLGSFAAGFRPADRHAAQRVHTMIANSSAVAGRIEEWWGREARVIHPPVDTDYYRPAPDVEREDFFLLAGRMVPYKRPDLAIKAAVRAGVPLVVAGDGRFRAECERHAGPTVRFIGRVSDDEQRDLYRRCRALLMPGVEDFGIVPVEAMACGAPVIAAAAGGALDTVLPGISGVHVEVTEHDEDAAVQAWADALAHFGRGTSLDADGIRRHAEGFSRQAFRQKMNDVVLQTLGVSTIDLRTRTAALEPVRRAG